MENVENKAMLKHQPMLIDTNVESHKKIDKFYEYQNHILTFATLQETPLHLIERDTKMSLGALRVGI